MIDMSQLLLKVSDQSSGLTTATDETNTDFALLVSMSDDASDDEKNPFLALIMHVMHMIPQESVDQEETVGDDSAELTSDATTESTAVSQKQATTISQADQEAPQIDATAEMMTPDTNKAIEDLEYNVAINWINAEIFVPPQPDLKVNNGTLQQLETLSTDVKGIVEQLSQDKPTMQQGLSQQQADDEQAPQDQLLSTENQVITETIDVPMQQVKEFSDLMSAPAETSQTIDQPTNIVPNTMVHSTLQPKMDAMPAQHMQISVPVEHPQWSQQFSEHIVWLGQHQNIKSAVIKLHPEELGPISIRVEVQKDTASVSIASHSIYVRDLVDQAIPQLKHMMQEQGIQLADVQISADSNPRHFANQNNSTPEASKVQLEEDAQITPLESRRPEGLVDYFA